MADPEEERKRRWPWFTIGLLTVLLAGFLIFLAVSGLTKADTREVPRVTGKQLVEAREILERAGFEVEETRVQSQLPLDEVVDQDPDPGTEADEGSTVVLEVSGGPGTVRVPSVQGLPVRQAIDRLEERGLRAELERRPSDDVEAGLALRSVPAAGEPVERGETVRVFISSGPEQVEVPDLTGLSRDSAEARLRDVGLTPGTVNEQESDEPEGEVLSQDPAGGQQVDRGTAVNLTVSTGVETVNVPNVLGLNRARRRGAARRRRARVRPARAAGDRPGAGRQGDRPAPGGRHRGGGGAPGGHHHRHVRGGGSDRTRRGAGHAAVRVAVLAGGRSSEHEVSLASAQSVREGLDDRRARAARRAHRPRRALDARRAMRSSWRRPAGCWAPTWSSRFCTAPTARTAPCRALLEVLDVAYVGAGVRLRRCRWTRRCSRTLWPLTGSRRWTTPWRATGRGRGWSSPLPVFVKPARLGSSVGISKASGSEELERALALAFEHDPIVVIERMAEGMEVECSVLGNHEAEASLPGEIVIRGSDWYDYEAKYTDGGMELVVPARVPSTCEEVRGLALEVFRLVGCAGMARVDFFVTGDGVLVNELNTIPGFTATSVYAKLWEASGVGYAELLDRLLGLALERLRSRAPLPALTSCLERQLS